MKQTQKIKIACWILAALLGLPLTVFAVANLAGGFAEGVTHSSDAGGPSLSNAAQAEASVSGAGHLGPEGVNGAGARIYIGFYDPVDAPIATSVDEWDHYR